MLTSLCTYSSHRLFLLKSTMRDTMTLFKRSVGAGLYISDGFVSITHATHLSLPCKQVRGDCFETGWLSPQAISCTEASLSNVYIEIFPPPIPEAYSSRKRG